MRKFYILRAGILFLLCAQSAAVEMPPSGFRNGWRKEEREQRISGQNLYGRINGGAELYLEFGFRELRVQEYRKGNKQLNLELYHMACDTAALGIYLMKCGKENPGKEIKTRNTVNRYQYMAIKGDYYIIVNNFSGDDSLKPVMTSLLNVVIEQIDRGAGKLLLSWLPTERIKGTEFIFRGPYALKPVFSFGPGDIFSLGGKIFGVGAQVKSDTSGLYTFIVIPYPTEQAAQASFEHVWQNLDSYHTRIKKRNNCFSFRDFQNKYATVGCDGKKLLIAIQMTKLPDHCTGY